ncbi:hypothetical protein C8R43DRAFT_186614 [Mycena crocata]|nr:hypothetical protein C8R43DRAFT_186614 [Mycena crocata]
MLPILDILHRGVVYSLMGAMLMERAKAQSSKGVTGTGGKCACTRCAERRPVQKNIVTRHISPALWAKRMLFGSSAGYCDSRSRNRPQRSNFQPDYSELNFEFRALRRRTRPHTFVSTFTPTDLDSFVFRLFFRILLLAAVSAFPFSLITILSERK